MGEGRHKESEKEKKKEREGGEKTEVIRIKSRKQGQSIVLVAIFI